LTPFSIAYEVVETSTGSRRLGLGSRSGVVKEQIVGASGESVCSELPYLIHGSSALEGLVRPGALASGLLPGCAALESQHTALLDGVLYTVCASGSTVVSVGRGDFTLHVRGFLPSEDATIPKPACPALVRASSRSARRPRAFAEHAAGADRDALWARALGGHRARFAARGTKACIFLHGAGQPDDLPAQNSFPKYWGKVEQVVTQCSSTTFVRANTQDFAWDNQQLMQKYCDTALQATGATGTTINNAIIFTHSMGNLIFSGALATGLCSLGSDANWWSVSGPITGSRVCDVLNTVCRGDHPSQALEILARTLDACVGTETTPSYKSMQENFPGTFKIAVEGFSKRAGLMCGDTPLGLGTLDSVGLSLLAQIAKLDSGANDGMVDLDNCSPGFSGAWSSNAADPDYKPAVNHGDTTCRNGDGFFGSDRMPCTWYATRT
jgi:hypothetical protein